MTDTTQEALGKLKAEMRDFRDEVIYALQGVAISVLAWAIKGLRWIGRHRWNE